MENSVIDLLFAKSHQHCLKTCPKHLCLLTPKRRQCLWIPCYPPHALAPLSSWAGSRQEPGALVMSKCLKIPLSTHTCFSQTKAPSFPMPRPSSWRVKLCAAHRSWWPGSAHRSSLFHVLAVFVLFVSVAMTMVRHSLLVVLNWLLFSPPSPSLPQNNHFLQDVFQPHVVYLLFS